MAKIIAFECDVCSKVAKAIPCNCCGDQRLPDDWIILRKLNPATADAEKEEDRYEYYCACSNEICQEFLRDNSGAEEGAEDNDDEDRPHTPNTGAVN